MCGIIGYLDDELGTSYVINGLQKLEYRGYDSCGLAYIKNGEFSIYKSTKRIVDLKEKIDNDGNIIIAHTRWATHGKVSFENAHPICSYLGNFIIVHNGIIENYQELKERYLKDIVLKTETDTEIIVNLIELFYQKNSNLISVLSTICSLLIGSFACLIINKNDDEKIYFMKRNSPLLIGIGKGIYIASDSLAFSETVEKFYRLNNNDLGYVTKKDVFIYNNSTLVNPKYTSFDYNNNDYNLGKYHHHMEKEIYDEPVILKRYLDTYINKNKISLGDSVEEILSKEFNNIYIIGSGTSYHAALFGSYFFKTISKKNAISIVSSEFYPDEYILKDDDLFILISQSGETADLIKVCEQIKNHKIIAITNVTTSTIATMASVVIDMKAGAEIAVASTKAYISSVTILYLLANMLIKNNPYLEFLTGLSSMNLAFNHLPIIIKLSKHIAGKEHLFFLGKSTDYLLAKEASLKLKEITYIHSESFQSGELKHGTIALITNGTPVIAIVTNSKYHILMRSAIEEVKTRGAIVYVISLKSLSKPSDEIIIDDTNINLSYLPVSIVFQLLAYYTALERGTDIDKPRNLAKSVTVL